MKSVRLFPILLVIYEVCSYLSNDMYLPALPQMTQNLNITQHVAQLTLTTWFLGSASMQFVFGPLADRYGRRPILFTGGILYVLATMVCAIAPDITTLLIARYIEGCCVCSVVIAGYATIHELYEQKQAIHILALMNSIIILAPVVGPLLGSVILQFANWRWIFWFIAIATIIMLLLLYKVMPETRGRHLQTPFNFKQLCHDYYAVFSNKTYMFNALAFCMLFAGMIGWIAMGSFLSITKFGYSPMMYALFQMLIFSGFIFGSHFVKYGLHWWGTTKFIWVGLAIALTGGAIGLCVATTFPDYFILFIISQTIFTTGTALTIAALSRLAVESTTVPMGIRMAVFSNLMCCSATLSTVLSSTLYNSTTLALSKIVFVSALLACLLRWKLTAAKNSILLQGIRF